MKRQPFNARKTKTVHRMQGQVSAWANIGGGRFFFFLRGQLAEILTAFARLRVREAAWLVAFPRLKRVGSRNLGRLKKLKHVKTC